MGNIQTLKPATATFYAYVSLLSNFVIAWRTWPVVGCVLRTPFYSGIPRQLATRLNILMPLNRNTLCKALVFFI
jgi:hypothetical protein